MYNVTFLQIDTQNIGGLLKKHLCAAETLQALSQRSYTIFLFS